MVDCQFNYNTIIPISLVHYNNKYIIENILIDVRVIQLIKLFFLCESFHIFFGLQFTALAIKFGVTIISQTLNHNDISCNKIKIIYIMVMTSFL